MKTFKFTITTILLIATLTLNLFVFKKQNETNKKLKENKKERKEQMDSLKKDIHQLEKRQNKKIKDIENRIKDLQIEQTKNKFNIYNPQIDSNFAKLFLKVVRYYNLDVKNENYLISQIITESRAKQYYNKSKNPIRGTSGEVGMCQIMPSTAIFMFEEIITQQEKQKMINLGATDFSHIKNRQQTIKWLSKTKNNIILWGYIMNYNINQCNNIVNSLVAYNKGLNGLSKLIQKGIKPKNHWYYQRIEVIKDNINKKS